ncbi:MAG: chromate efflux transporter [Alcanivoracaceae bacterium]|nr:chromate efflux transporter [Alcanivoracaceae bacterium]
MNSPTLQQAIVVWVRVALLSFGGPAAQIAVMHRIVVEEKRWVDEPRFMHALNFCMLLPGPEAQQLATYLGWLMHGVRGGLIAGILFILPGFFAILALSFLYAYLLDVSLVAALFFGLKAAVLALVLLAVKKIASKALMTRPLAATGAVSFISIAIFDVPFPLIISAAAFAGYLWAKQRPAWLGDSLLPADSWRPQPVSMTGTARVLLIGFVIWLLPLILMLPTLGGDHVLVTEALFFSKVAVVTFGGAYSVLAYIAQQAVDVYQWLLPDEMLDGLGMAESTPGPLIQVVQFVGFMAAFRDAAPFSPPVAAVLGSLVTTWAAFVPCFVFVFAGAPHIERLRHNMAIAGALRGITAAVVGVIASLALWFASHVLFAEHRLIEFAGVGLSLPMPASIDLASLSLFAGALLALLKLNWGIGRVLIITVAVGAGLDLFPG